ncbi:hypothetical protein Scani_14210 [Streptomyces caniferus]|uniref:Uncharacterized protein n=1 Tax=Streptomyces caniferus TaxID=285557 RepID=A0A640S157_9ACTN|nr:hypothetical protein Scani_14210 [Streptomyces caniferus]
MSRTGAVRAPSAPAFAAGGALRTVPGFARSGHPARRLNRHVRYRPAAARRQLVGYKGELCPRWPGRTSNIQLVAGGGRIGALTYEKRWPQPSHAPQRIRTDARRIPHT